ncbi:MAG: tetratricopeptide repeat protein [Pseudomonadota bacterium]
MRGRCAALALCLVTGLALTSATAWAQDAKPTTAGVNPPTSTGEAAPDVARAADAYRKAADAFVVAFKAERYREAIRQGLRALSLAEKGLGRDHAIVAKRAFYLGLAYRRAGQARAGLPHLRRAYRHYASKSTQVDGAFFDVVDVLADVLGSLNQRLRQVQVLRRGIARLGPLDPEGSLQEAALQDRLGVALRHAGRFKDAENAMRRAIAIKRKRLPARDVRIATSLNALAGLLRQAGRYEQAEPLYREALTIMRKARGEDDVNVGVLLDNLAVLQMTRGHAREAERLQKRALAILEAKLGPEHYEVGQVIANLAANYQSANRIDEALPLVKRAVAIFRATLRPDDYRLGFTLDNLAGLYREQGRQKLAQKTYREALAILQAAYPTGHPEIATARNNLAISYTETGNLDEARALLAQAIASAVKAYGREHREHGIALSNLGDVYLKMGKRKAAREALAKALGVMERALGASHGDIMPTLRRLGDLDLTTGRETDALQAYRRGIAIYLARRREERDVRRGSANAEALRYNLFSGAIRASWAASRSGSGVGGTQAGDALRDEAFRMSQWMALTTTAMAVNLRGVRERAGSPALQRAVRARQDLERRWQRLDRQLIEVMGQADSTTRAARRAALQAELTTIDAKLARSDKLLLASYPRYAALAHPKPLSIEQVQRLLRPHEALLHYARAHDQLFAWLITPDQVRWIDIDVGAAAMKRDVERLRCGLDPTLWSRADGAQRCRGLTLAGPDDNGGLPFDVATAQRLYERVIAPFAKDIRRRDLLISKSGALSALPFHLLVRRGAGEPGDAGTAVATGTAVAWSKVDWLVRHHATSVLPSVASLAVQRPQADAAFAPTRAATAAAAVASQETPARRPYLGIGNPILTGANGDDRSAARVPRCADVPNLATPPAEMAVLRGGRRAAYGLDRLRKLLVAPAQLRRLDPLPETAIELCAVARQLGAPTATNVLLGASASERQLKALNASDDLARYRVIHVATHGLVAGDIRGLAEPALLLTPPARATLADDGLLTAGEVAALRLNADWVILSACNTAAGDAVGAPALSGLARAFLYAGARALLVSHWPVDTQAAVTLTTTAIAALGQDGDARIGRAQALRRAMLAMIDKGGDPLSAHPQIWAPFEVVGEGGSMRRARSTPVPVAAKPKPAIASTTPTTTGDQGDDERQAPSSRTARITAPSDANGDHDAGAPIVTGALPPATVPQDQRPPTNAAPARTPSPAATTGPLTMPDRRLARPLPPASPVRTPPPADDGGSVTPRPAAPTLTAPPRDRDVVALPERRPDAAPAPRAAPGSGAEPGVGDDGEPQLTPERVPYATPGQAQPGSQGRVVRRALPTRKSKPLTPAQRRRARERTRARARAQARANAQRRRNTARPPTRRTRRQRPKRTRRDWRLDAFKNKPGQSRFR